MTRLDWQGLAVLFGVVLVASVAVLAYDAVMYARHGTAGTISHGMSALARKTAAFPAVFGLLVGLAVGYLWCHWFE